MLRRTTSLSEQWLIDTPKPLSSFPGKPKFSFKTKQEIRGTLLFDHCVKKTKRN